MSNRDIHQQLSTSNRKTYEKRRTMTTDKGEQSYVLMHDRGAGIHTHAHTHTRSHPHFTSLSLSLSQARAIFLAVRWCKLVRDSRTGGLSAALSVDLQMREGTRDTDPQVRALDDSGCAQRRHKPRGALLACRQWGHTGAGFRRDQCFCVKARRGTPKPLLGSLISH